MATLFNPIEPYDAFYLDVGSHHRIYVEEVGNKKGIPILFIHGGPGGGLEPKHRQYFDPKKWRIILFDQRGCGQSTPFGELKENTTFDLIADMEKIRHKLNIDRWHLFGGSWGSTLALAYAIMHPAKVASMILRGIFLLRKSEINWFYQYGAHMFYPEEWEHFLAPIPSDERHNLLSAYHLRLNSHDEKVVKEAAKAWSTWEGATIKLRPDKEMKAHFMNDRFAYAFARIENHYFYHNGFFEHDSWILHHVAKLNFIPSFIVQGRYDMPCPPISAYELHQAWPKSKLMMIEAAGHSASEPDIIDALVSITNAIS